MNTAPQIDKSPKLQNGEDYNFLRNRGIELLQEFAGEVWTDHNVHDPGITLLEAFCFALTELALKANLDIKDIIASGQQNSNQVLYEPQNILPSQPITLADYKKILIDTEGVRNGWLIPISSWEIDDVNGIYDVLLELDDHETLGDLNSGIIERSFTIDIGGGVLRSYVIEVSFPPWDEVIPFREQVVINSITSPGFLDVILSTTTPDDQNDYQAELEITYDGGLTTSFSVTIRVTPTIGADISENTAVENQITTILSDVTAGGVSAEYNSKVAAAALIEQEVILKLNSYRNIAEDFRDIKSIRIQEIALSVRIDLLKAVNLEKYLAAILFKLETFFKPIIQFSSLAELESQNISFEKIYEGPRLTNGFLDDTFINSSLQGINNPRNSVVYVSDLVNLLTQVAKENTITSVNLEKEQIIAISSITISNYIRNKVVVKNAEDCLVLGKAELYKPRFSFNKSNIKFYRNNIEQEYNADLVAVLLDELRSEAQFSDLVNNTPILPSGELLPINDFYSIQHDFPAAYGLGKNILSSSFPLSHRAKVEQFRAYLTLVDQLLASYSNQLAHINDLFSIDPDIKSSYFKTPSYSIPYYEKLLINFMSSGQSWEDFINDSSNDYEETLNAVFESNSLFINRRNRFLDHLLARFSTSLENYTSFRYEETSPIVLESEELNFRQLEIDHDLILHKINYLSLFPEHSRDRFKAFDYMGSAWDTINTSLLAKRVLTSSGFKNLNRRTLYNEAFNFIQTNAIGPNFNFEIIDADSNVMLVSTTTFPDAGSAQDAALNLIEIGINRDNYHIEEQVVPGGTEYLVGIHNDPSMFPLMLATIPTPLGTDKFEARTTIRHIINELKEIGSGIYIVEHVLLRPSETSTVSLQIPTDNISFVSNPYSMRLTIVLPSGFERDFSVEMDPIPTIPTQFQEEKFRNFVLKQIKKETPAHILTDVYWLDINTAVDLDDTPSLTNFTERWRAWLEAKENPLTTDLLMETAREELINVLNAIYQTSL